MICPKCGAAFPDGSGFCPFCGTGAGYKAAGAFPRAMFSSPLFLALCILVSVYAVLDFRGGGIFALLYAIALWLIYSNAVAKNQPISAGGYKFVYVVTKIRYILSWIAAGFMAVCGILSAVLIPMFSSTFFSLIEQMLSSDVELSAEVTELLNDLYYVADSMTGAILAVIVFFACIISAALICVVNLCFTKYYMNYAKELADAAKPTVPQAQAPKIGSVATRLLVNGILTAVPAVTDLAGLSVRLGSINVTTFLSLAPLCISAAYIVGYVMLKKEAQDVGQ